MTEKIILLVMVILSLVVWDMSLLSFMYTVGTVMNMLIIGRGK